MRVIILCVLLSVALALRPLPESEYQAEFVQFMSQYAKAYDTVESTFKRFNVFRENLDKIRDINAQNLTWWAGVNEFSDLTEQEFLAAVTGHLAIDTQVPRESAISIGNEANDIDWRTKGAVTPVKNQGSCGSCWAFSAVGAVESWWFLKSQQLITLSEQQVLDCCKDSCSGCNGGQESNAINWAKKGLCKGSDYPYTGRAGACKTTCTPVVKNTGVKRLRSEADLITSLNQLPVAVAVNANGGWQSYKGGIFSGPCTQQLNHAVLAVGYTDQAILIKNSWGATWGTAGYISLARGKNPTTCGVGKEPSYPI